MKLNFLTIYLINLLVILVQYNKITPAWGQPIVPAEDGTQTRVNQEGNQFNIEGGTVSGDGSNLFHSLEKFGLNADQIANFLANPQIRNILTRVVGGDPSIINGLIQVIGSDANLFLMNPAGIIFGPDVQLNLPADFTATTATGIGFNDDYWFNALGSNNYQFLTGDPSQFAFDLAQSGSIINTGNLSVLPGHNLTLIGETIINTGKLQAPGGNITIAAIPGTNRIRISQPGSLVSLEIIAPRQTNPELLGIKPQDLPTLLTQGSQTIDLNITNNSNGNIGLREQNIDVFTSPGTLITSGTLETFSPSQMGGNITLIGDRMGVIDGQIDASGYGGGGIIRIGGDYRGTTTLPTAQRTLIDSSSNISSDGINEGNGGQITVWGEEITGFYGQITSRGGAFSGNGGLVEISGKQQLIFRGNVDTSAVNGDFGTLLLDPVNIVIRDGEGDGATDGTNTFAGNNSGQVGQVLSNDIITDRTPTIIFESELEGLLGDTNIILEAFNNITIEDLSDNALTFEAGTGEIIFRVNTDKEIVGSFRMSQDDSIVAPGRNLTIERLGDNLETSGCFQPSDCEIIVGDIDTSFSGGGGSVRITARGNAENFFPSIEVGRINTSSTQGLGGVITIETLATNGEIAGTVKIAEILFEPNNINQFTQDILNTQGVDRAAPININGTQLDLTPITPPVPGIPPSNPNPSAPGIPQPPSNPNPPAPGTPPGIPPSNPTPPPPAQGTPPSNPNPPITETPQPPSNSTPPLELIETEALSTIVNLNNAYSISNQPNNSGGGSQTSINALSTSSEADIMELRKVEATFLNDFVNHLGIDWVPCVSLEEIQNQLQQAQQATQLKPGLVYIFFKPSTNEGQSSSGQNLWRFNSGCEKKSAVSKNEPSDQDQLELILVTASGDVIRHSVTGVTRGQVLSKAQEFQRTVTNPRRPSAYLQPAQQLYSWFIEPLKTTFDKAELDTLVFIVDSGLRSVPMSALHDGSQFLVESYNLSIMPSFALTNSDYQDITKERVLAMGASQFDGFNPLPAVPLELSVIADRIWPGNSFLNQKFTLENLKQEHQSGKFGIIHLATHANFQSGQLSNSYIQLWEDTLSLDQFKQLDFGDPQVELLVLSACRTALGDEEAELGFAGIAVLANVKSVLGSLWEVNDQGTLGLMTSFYGQLQDVPLKTKAVREAQLSLLRGEVYLENGELVSQNNRLSLPPQLAKLGNESFTHPYFWSGFTLVGSPW
ncbi:CHAT domain-containing protein [Crocosphaera sp. Alani8]|uniref:CHAT domain-containing protein n=1 Tax=Crocosphaera sp. Alani8 TaxID=3038952 RepID=UPI00313A7A05